jgi:hypothetical protein
MRFTSLKPGRSNFEELFRQTLAHLGSGTMRLSSNGYGLRGAATVHSLCRKVFIPVYKSPSAYV